MSGKVTIVDYGIGNLYSVCRALEYCGAEIELTDKREVIASATHLVLPGVGAFADGMLGLRDLGLVDPIRRFANRDGKLLGICLGMQMLLSASEEFGEHEGLDLIPGRVVRIPNTGVDGKRHKIPHVGWSALIQPPTLSSWEGTILTGTRQGSEVYLVHSFTAVPDSPHHRLADCYYDGRLIAAAIRSGNVYGCQFHPEKSGSIGLDILRQFCMEGI